MVVETRPGRWQAWIRVSMEPLLPTLATRIAKRLVHIYEAARASADWRHLARLVGFTNRKPQRRRVDGLAPWVKLIHAQACLARQAAELRERAAAEPASAPRATLPFSVSTTAHDSASLEALYRDCLNRLRIREPYPAPDWSIADRWVARELLATGTDAALVAAVLRHGSPGFPRRHADPEDYLRRTLRSVTLFSSAPRPRLLD